MRVLQTPNSGTKSEVTSEEGPVLTEDSPEDETGQEEPPSKPPDVIEEPEQITNETTS
jgi:hypothetical protein